MSLDPTTGLPITTPPAEIDPNTGLPITTPPAEIDPNTGLPITTPPEAPPEVAPSGAVTLSATQFAELLAAARQGSGAGALPTAPIVRLTADEVPKVGSYVRDAHGRPALVLEVLETERADASGSWTQYVCLIGSFTETRALDAEELGAL